MRPAPRARLRTVSQRLPDALGRRDGVTVHAQVIARCARAQRQRAAESALPNGNSMHIPHSQLPAALEDAAFHLLDGGADRLAVYLSVPPGDVPRRSRPVLLVHSVNAAASAAEVRPLFDAMKGDGVVCALDLPGFGHSRASAVPLEGSTGQGGSAESGAAGRQIPPARAPARVERRYTTRQMTDAVATAARWLSQREGGAPVRVIGVSLGCEFVARAAVENPALFADLTLVSPTGLRGGQRLRGPRGSTRYVALADRVIRGPGWGPFLFRQLTRPSVIRYFLRRTWGAREIDEALWAYCCSAARQPGAEHAPLSFLSAALFSADIHDVYEAVRAPVLVVHGTRGDFTDYHGLPLPGVQRPWQVHVMQHAGALPYFERLPEFLSVWRRFAAAVDARIDDAGTPGCP
jgi:pimeloyl-ACP methyl ester carboxylesterase